MDCGKALNYHYAVRCQSCANAFQWSNPSSSFREKRMEASKKLRETNDTYANREWMRSRYEDDGMSLRQIAGEAGCSLRTAARWMKEHAIPMRPARKPQNPDYEGFRYGPNWREQKRKARYRDGYACRVCGVAESELPRMLDVHHITPARSFGGDYKAANNLRNLVSMCNACHRTAEMDRKEGEKMGSGFSFRAYVVRWVDADTVLCDPQIYKQDTFLRVRLRDVWEPEIGEDGEDAARAKAEAAFPPKSLIQLTDERTTWSYDRLVARVDEA